MYKFNNTILLLKFLFQFIDPNTEDENFYTDTSTSLVSEICLQCNSSKEFLQITVFFK